MGGRVDDSWVPPDVYGYGPPKSNQYSYRTSTGPRADLRKRAADPIELTIGWSPEEGAQFGHSRRRSPGCSSPLGVEVPDRACPPCREEQEHREASGRSTRPWHGWVGGAGFDHRICCPSGRPERDGGSLPGHGSGVGKASEGRLDTADGPARIRLFSDIEQRIADLCPRMPLYAETTIHAHKSVVRGFRAPASGLLPRYGEVYRADGASARPLGGHRDTPICHQPGTAGGPRSARGDRHQFRPTNLIGSPGDVVGGPWMTDEQRAEFNVRLGTTRPLGTRFRGLRPAASSKAISGRLTGRTRARWHKSWSSAVHAVAGAVRDQHLHRGRHGARHTASATVNSWATGCCAGRSACFRACRTSGWRSCSSGVIC